MLPAYDSDKPNTFKLRHMKPSSSQQRSVSVNYLLVDFSSVTA